MSSIAFIRIEKYPQDLNTQSATCRADLSAVAFRNPANPISDLSREKAVTVPDESKAKPVTYADAGVDITSGDRAKDRIKYLAQKTFNRNVLGGIGGFGALFRLDLQRWKNPILVSSADGVGTKLKVAFELGLHQTGGRRPGQPLRERHRRAGRDAAFFSRLPGQRQDRSRRDRSVVTGLAEACKANGCALIGGETAQMPGFYSDGEYDLAGFIVGAVDRDKMVTGVGHQAWRCADRLAFDRLAYQWIFPGAQAAV